MENLPQLNLSNEQQQIINAHAAGAVMSITNTTFNAANRDDAVSNIIFQQGMLRMCHTLLNYDAEMLKQAQAAAPAQVEENS